MSEATNTPLVCIIVLNHNGYEHLQYSLPSITATDYPSLKILVVDNSSSDDSVQYVKQHYPDVELMASPVNLGWSGGNNEGIKCALKLGAKHIILANNDIRVDERWVKEAVKLVDTDHSIGIVGFQIHEPRGGLPYDAGFEEAVAQWSALETLESQRAQGMAMFVRASLFEQLGLIDEGYFVYWEENDFEKRAWKAGYRTVITNIPVWHHGQGYFEKAPMRAAVLQIRNSLRLSIKNDNLLGILYRVACLFGRACFLKYDPDNPVARRLCPSNIVINVSIVLYALAWNLLQLPRTLRSRCEDNARVQSALRHLELSLSDGGREIRGKTKLAIVVSHPVHYQIPLYRQLSALPHVDLVVYYCWEGSARRPVYDPEYGKEVRWDVDVLEGYSHKFLRNYSLRPSSSVFGQLNPGIVIELLTNKYDAVWVHGYSTIKDWLSFAAAWLTKTPILVRGESNLLQTRSLCGRVLRRIILPLFFRRVSGFLTIGSKNEEFYSFYGVPTSRMYHSPYAVDNERLQYLCGVLSSQKEQIKQQLCLPPEKRVILYVSKLISRKRPFDLLRVYEELALDGDSSLVFVGDGPLRSKLEFRAQQAGLDDVYFFGFRSQAEISRFYSIGDVFVLPSSEESWGMIVNEAMNFGLPVITTDKVGSAYDLVRHGDNGFIYEAGNVEALSASLKTILDDPRRLREMGRLSTQIIATWSFEQDVRGLLKSLEHFIRE